MVHWMVHWEVQRMVQRIAGCANGLYRSYF
ncbi:hypothetical protein M2105_000830 [Paenibacillus sp. PastF-1]|nr:hypothetical protein [Paenibacillus sp. PastF-1]